MHGRGLGVNPAQFVRCEKLFRSERDAEHDFDIRDILLNIFIGVELGHFDVRKLSAEAFRKPGRSNPQLETMMGENEQLAHVMWCVENYDFFTRRSDPVISFGSGTLSIPKIVGEISRSDPPDFNVNCLKFSATRMNGTGLVVCAVCGPPVTGSISISALP